MKAVQIVDGMHWAGAFGSHGGSGAAIRAVTRELRHSGIEVINDGLRVHYKPTKDDLVLCTAMGRELAVKMKAM